MSLREKLLLILVLSAAMAAPTARAAAEHAPAGSVAVLLYGAEMMEFRALIASAGPFAPAAGISAEPVCYAAPAPRAQVGAPVAAGQPAGAMGLVLAGPVAAAHAASMPRPTVESAGKELLPLTALPAPSSWKLVLCAFAFLGFIAVRKARYATG